MALVTIYAEFGKADTVPAKGKVMIAPWLDAVRVTPPNPELITRARLDSALDTSGVWAEQVIPSDDPDWQTTEPVPYLVKWSVSGSYGERIVVIPSPGPWSLWELVDIADPTVVPVPIPGPEGPPGAASTVPGPEGPPGPQGLQGLVSVVGTATGAAGSSAVVTDSDPSPNRAALTFTIPRGNTGSAGATGPAGPAGAASTVPGPTGATGPAGADSTVPGPEGPAGPPGTAYMSAQWTFNQTTTAPPVSGGLRFNATTIAATTQVFISETDRDGLNRTAGLDQMTVGDQLMVQSAQGRAVFNVTSAADSGTYRTLGVTVAEFSGTRPNASAITTVYSVTTGGAGSTILSGTATPTGATGAVGDYYLDTDDRILYGPKNVVGAPDSVTPVVTSSSGGSVNVGMCFKFLAAGVVVGVKVYLPAGAAGTNWRVNLWALGNTTALATKAAATLTAGAWNDVLFDTPVAVDTATTYVASSYCPSGSFYAIQNSAYPGQTSSYVQGLTDAQAGGSTFRYTGSINYPDTTWAGHAAGVSPLFASGVVWPVALKSVPPGGTTGQFLKKSSAADYAVAWVT